MNRMKDRKGVWAVLILAVALVFAWGVTQKNRQDRVMARFLADRAQLETVARQVLEQGSAEGLDLPEGWRDVKLYNAQNDLKTVEFSFGASGVGSETSYWGVNYIPYDKPLGFQGTRWDYWKAQGNGRLFYDPEGDNTCYVERLDSGWYYYEARF